MQIPFHSFLLWWIFLCRCWGQNRYNKDNVDIYLNDFTEEKLLNSIHVAEHELRIYIYNATDVFRPIELKNSLKHFRSEYLFIDYLQMISDSNVESDHRKAMIVSNPDQANVFIIEHKVFNGKFHSVDEMVLYIRAVVDRVVNDLPYYKLHGGKDHYFFGVHSNGKLGYALAYHPVTYSASSSIGPFCMDGWREPLAKEFQRIAGANYIGNYGMDEKYEEDNPLSDVPCHRAGKDIVIPQYMGQWSNMFLAHSNLYRPYDSVWAGSIWGDRDPLVQMNLTMETDYHNLLTERFQASFGGRRRLSHGSRRLIDSDLAHLGYFGYNPCGLVCWSQRLYYELNQHTIPIIVSSGGILPFDRFVNWTTFSMKITSEIWNDKSLLLNWRRKIRKESDVFRQILDDYFEHYAKLHHISSHSVLKNEIVSEIAVEGRSSPSFNLLKETYIWRKLLHIEEALPWLYIKDDIKRDRRKHAFRLLCLEIWCRLDQQQKTGNSVCQNRSDRTSRMSYE
jgi:hypothetical protein